VHLRADSVACIDHIMARDPTGKELRAEWKKLTPNEVELQLPLHSATPGALTLLISQHGAAQPTQLSVQTFAAEARLERFSLHAGDREAVITGSRLDTVTRIELGEAVFLPGELSTQQASDRLRVFAEQATAFTAGQQLTATATLNDGRRIRLPVVIESSRPHISVLGRHVSRSSATDALALQADEMAPDDVLRFSVRATGTERFAREQTLEIATPDGSDAVSLSTASGAIRLENSKVAVARFEPAKRFDADVFGPLQVRSLFNGIAGDWQPLVHLVRLPTLSALRCTTPADTAALGSCVLQGQALYLIEAVSATAGFEQAVVLPEGFTGSDLAVPAPGADGLLYLRLRDRPEIVRPLRLPALSAPG